MMCMSKIEYKDLLDVMVGKIFKIFHIFAESSNVSSEESTPLVLLMVSMFKDSLIHAQSLNNYDSFDKFLETIDRLSHGQEKNVQYQDIVQIMRQSLAKINNHCYKRICYTLCELDDKFLKENFAKVFDNVLYRVSQSQGRYFGEFLQPIELTRLITGMAELKPGSKVYNPFAGLASFSIYLDPNIDYYGQELYEKNWVLGALRLIAYRQPVISKYVCEDSILQWPEPSEKFDLIVANPPYEIKLGEQYIDIDPHFKTIEQFLIEKGVDSLAQNGKLIAILPTGFLFKGMQEDRLRKRLVDEDLIDTIVSLPGGLVLNTDIPLIILVLNKNKKNQDKVRFVDAKNFVNDKGSREKLLDDHTLSSFIRNEIDDENVIRIVDSLQIREKDYNLRAQLYFQKQIEGVKLGVILEQVMGQRGNLPETGKLIRIRDLKDDKIDFTLDISEVEEAELRRPDINVLSESCLLLALRWRTLKPTLFEFKGEPIYSRQNILSFKVDESIVDKAYLINELYADYVQEQLEAYGLGDLRMPFIRTDDLMQIVIKLPSLEEQRKKINNVFQEILFKEKDKIAFIRKIFNEELGVKQHNIRQHLKNVKDSLDTLIDYMEKKGGILNKEDVINPNRNVTVGKRFDKMYASLENVIEEINTLTNEQSFSLSEPIDLIDLITASVDEIIHPNFEVVLTKDEVGILGTELDKLIIKYSVKDLKELINNVVENAVRHGFTDKDKFYKIVFDISVDDETAVLTIKNNGAPFPKNISSHIGVKGKKAGKFANQGIGAWKIVQSIENFGHKYEIIDEPENEFPVGWIFKFKLITE